MLRFALTLALLASPLSAQALALTGYGVICDIEKGRTRPAPDTVSGVLNVVNQHHPIDVHTATVPAEMGLSFGIRADLPDGAEGGTFSIIVTHPPMGPQGQTVESWTTTLSPGDPALNLFTFELPYELVQGDWRFQIARADDIVLEQHFTVLPAGSVPAVQRACRGSVPMS
ncbi:DUF3859 domain-containing protein [Sagittula sp. NFXS13]|uniref:DUF3859 domain-containing protein n=1 Tax=Sagittula sp. NFXS13 TaxID=2819095 RepID=UPI0032DF9D2E